MFWTGFESALSGDPRLTAHTYLWMFPIYGLAVFLEPLHNAIRRYPWFIRGMVWVLVIFALEYSTGGLIRLITGYSPWNYSGTSPWEIHGLIRLDMAPLWFITGFIFEQVHDYLTRRLNLQGR
ncbi:putative membrane protein [Desulfohalotomaculum tongense]|nr:putative membrane protein [Desulforadius tongensis]